MSNQLEVFVLRSVIAPQDGFCSKEVRRAYLLKQIIEAKKQHDYLKLLHLKMELIYLDVIVY